MDHKRKSKPVMEAHPEGKRGKGKARLEWEEYMKVVTGKVHCRRDTFYFGQK